MDWRNRNYYLIKTSPCSYKMRHEIYRIAAPSIKYHAPYNHFKDRKRYYFDYDGDHFGKIKMLPHEMVSCLKEDSEALEYELNKAERRDYMESKWVKLTKEMLGQ